MRPVALLLVTVCAASAQYTREGAYWVRTLSGSEPVSGRARVRVMAPGDVEATPSSDDRVSYTVRLRAKAREALADGRISIQREHDQVTVFVRCDADAAEMQVKIPRTARETTIVTREGNVQVYELGGAVTAASAGGAMKADRIRGSLEMRTGGGTVWLGSVEGPVKASTAGGAITAGRIGGDAILETGGGVIVAQEVGGYVRAKSLGGTVKIGRAGAGVVASTGGGPIEVGEAGGVVEAHNSGGPVSVGRAAGVHCESAVGPIRLSNVSGPLRASTALGSILAEVVAGHALADSFLSTGSGDITIVLPSNLGVRIYALSETAGRNQRIVSDFPGLVIRQQGRQVIAEGAINGGGPLIRLAGTGGTIFIKRQ
ncbi:MAG: hypothetical protein ACE15B_18990 [Bryobacteraceae bacterium]